jgi:hypothetical protein
MQASIKTIHPSAKPAETQEASVAKTAKTANEALHPMRRQAAITKGLLTLSNYQQWAGRVRGSWKR